jgi:predicted RNase H-like HicB family nuclease
MTPHYFPVVIERETNGSYSAWVAGLPGVYAAADTAAAAKRAVRGALKAHLGALEKAKRRPAPKTVVTVLRWDAAGLRYVGVSALMGRSTSSAKAAAARRNGMKGGRPRASSR